MKRQIFSAWKHTPATCTLEGRYFVFKMWTWKLVRTKTAPSLFPAFPVSLSQLNCIVLVHPNFCFKGNFLAENTSAGFFPEATKSLGSNAVLSSLLFPSSEIWVLTDWMEEFANLFDHFLLFLFSPSLTDDLHSPRSQNLSHLQIRSQAGRQASNA